MDQSLNQKTKESMPKENSSPKKTHDYPVQPFKDKEFALNFYSLMVRTRALEEKLIKMSKSSDGFFWIGGPGEEAFQISLGLQVDKGHGLEHDMLHLHYRSIGCVLAMGEPSVSFIRQMRTVETDPFTGGRNFSSHPLKKEWNIFPVTSTIETQFSVAPGSGRAQWREYQKTKKAGVTVVLGGDAGTAESDFATCLVWCSRPKEELPVLMIVTNNQFGISTPASTQHGEKHISDRAKSFGIKTANADGNNPEKVWAALRDAFEYVRESRLPFLLELSVSRLNGHSSSSGANRVTDEEDCLEVYRKKLEKLGWLTPEEASEVWTKAVDEMNEGHAQARSENFPGPDTIGEFVFADDNRSEEN